MIEKFLEVYLSAFLSFSPTAITEFYEYPAIFYTESGEVVSFDKSQFLDNSKAMLANYKKLGVVNLDFTIQDNSQLSNSLRLVSVQWTFTNKSYETIYTSTTRYIVKEAEGGLKITSVIMVDEYSAFTEAMSKIQ